MYIYKYKMKYSYENMYLYICLCFIFQSSMKQSKLSNCEKKNACRASSGLDDGDDDDNNSNICIYVRE